MQRHMKEPKSLKDQEAKDNENNKTKAAAEETCDKVIENNESGSAGNNELKDGTAATEDADDDIGISDEGNVDNEEVELEAEVGLSLLGDGLAESKEEMVVSLSQLNFEEIDASTERLEGLIRTSIYRGEVAIC